MNATEIEDGIVWRGGLGYRTLRVALLDAELPFVFFPPLDQDETITEKMAATATEVLQLQAGELPRIKDMLWEEANFSFYVSDYGVEALENETSQQAHLREFGIAGPDDAYGKSRVREVHVEDEFDSRFARLVIETGANNLISIVVMDGRIIDWDDDGAYLGAFEEDERAAFNRRRKILKWP